MKIFPSKVCRLQDLWFESASLPSPFHTGAAISGDKDFVMGGYINITTVTSSGYTCDIYHLINFNKLTKTSVTGRFILCYSSC